jgi:DNA polymerase I
MGRRSRENESCFETEHIQTIENVLSPLDWNRTDLRQELVGAREPELTDFQ